MTADKVTFDATGWKLEMQDMWRDAHTRVATFSIVCFGSVVTTGTVKVDDPSNREIVAKRLTLAHPEINTAWLLTALSQLAADHVPNDTGAPFVGKPEDLTDIGNGLRFVIQHGRDVRYTPQRGWFIWDGTRFAPDLAEISRQRAKMTNLDLYRLAAGLNDDARKPVLRFAKESTSMHGVRNALEAARTEPGIMAMFDIFDTDPYVLNVQNGTLNLRTGELREHSRGDMLTKLAPVKFDPGANCPRWLAFLERIMDGSKEKIAYLQRAAGYSLTGITDEHVLFLCYGTGRNGKGTFMETMLSMLGDYSQTTPFETFLHKDTGGIPNDLAAMVGARFVTASEAPEGRRLAETTIKAITGGDMIAARFLHKEFFRFQPAFKIWLAANHKPSATETTEGFWSRIHLLPYTVQIPEAERILNLKELLRDEWSGILNWALEGCLQWQAHGLQAPASVREATGEYRQENDPIAAFIDEWCVIGTMQSTTVDLMYRAYAAWATMTQGRPRTKLRFGAALRERGYSTEEVGVRHVHTWIGIGLTDEAKDKGTYYQP